MKGVAQSVLMGFLLLTAAHSAEIDSMTPRYVALKDATDAVNDIFEHRLRTGVDKANTKTIGRRGQSACDETILYNELRKSIFQSLTASWGLKGYALDKQLREELAIYSYSLSLNDSIYRDLNYLEAFSLNLKELSDLVNVDGHLIGMDKFGHFFAEGWRYFQLTQNRAYELADAADWGALQEQGKFGYATTGIFSFADLTANFNGWRFWNRLLLLQDDPISNAWSRLFNGSYVKCELQVIESIRQRQIVRAWSYAGGFDFADYIDGAWDEGNNCNSYKDPLIEQKVESRLQHLKPALSCPIDRRSCLAAQQHYGDYAKYLLHPQCLAAR